MQDRKNVLFIVIDQLRADCVFGPMADHVDLPNLKALMGDAVTFQRHFSVVNPCGPSRASLLTGQYAMNHRSIRNGTPLRHDTPTIASEMRRAGYLPMLFGYTDTSQDPRVFHANDPAVRTYEYQMAGFQEMVEMRLEMSYPWRAHLKNKGYQFEHYEDVFEPVSSDGGPAEIDDPALYRAEDSDTAFLTNRFLELMPGFDDHSWFAHLTYIRPHPPLVAPAPFNRMYDPSTLPLPSRLKDRRAEAEIHPFCTPSMANASPSTFVQGFPDLDATDSTVQRLRAIYLGLATEVDQHIGRVVDFLKESGQYDNTLFIVTADHGEMLGDRYCWGKSSFYDAAYHTPLIVRKPGSQGQAGTVIDVPTESIDIAPTILDWVGQEIPNSMDGRSLLPWLSGEEPEDWRQYTFSELDVADPIAPTHWEQHLGLDASSAGLSIIRDDRFTLIEFAADLPPVLFDHHGLGEFENVADRIEYQGDLARLTRMMLRHRMRNADHTLSMSMITHDGPKTARRHLQRR